MRYGWQCPKCESIYAPWISGCDECNRSVKQPKENKSEKKLDEFDTVHVSDRVTGLSYKDQVDEYYTVTDLEIKKEKTT